MMVGFYIFGWFCFQVNLPSLLLLQLCVRIEMKVCVHVCKEYEKKKVYDGEKTMCTWSSLSVSLYIYMIKLHDQHYLCIYIDM
ncbi:hypothetical protein Hanom_Chr04g00375651 [Helianthus anomalus]